MTRQTAVTRCAGVCRGVQCKERCCARSSTMGSTSGAIFQKQRDASIFLDGKNRRTGSSTAENAGVPLSSFSRLRPLFPLSIRYYLRWRGFRARLADPLRDTRVTRCGPTRGRSMYMSTDAMQSTLPRQGPSPAFWVCISRGGQCKACCPAWVGHQQRGLEGLSGEFPQIRRPACIWTKSPVCASGRCSGGLPIELISHGRAPLTLGGAGKERRPKHRCQKHLQKKMGSATSCEKKWRSRLVGGPWQEKLGNA
jgi:hypothetical protein